MKTLKRLIKQAFCFHRWETLKRERFNIMGVRKKVYQPVGEVTITTLRCQKCDKVTLVPSDKKMYDKTEV